MKVRDIMTRDVKTARPEDTIQQVARLMSETDTGVIPITEGLRPIGLLTDRDIVIRALAEGRGLETTASQIMTTNLELVQEDDDLTDVTDRMSRQQIRRVLVVDNNRDLCGIVSLGDVSLEDKAKPTGKTLEQISDPGASPSH
jgi:CBS domain-containing protein